MPVPGAAPYVRPHRPAASRAGGGWPHEERDTTITALDSSPRRRLDDSVRAVSGLRFTDDETRHGAMPPHQALARYRERTGIAARLAVVAMTPTRFSIADPTDPGMLDVAGFDTSTPGVLSDFSRGAI